MSRVKGARKLRRTLQRIDPEITKEVKATLLRGAQIIQRDAVALAPRRDGNLRAALEDPKAIGVKSNGFKVEFGIRLKRQKRIAWYAHFVEFGTKGFDGAAPKGSGGKKGPYRLRVPPMRAQPFIGPAFAKNRKMLRRMREKAINKALRRAARV